MPAVFVARLICSDEACAVELAAEAATLRELETLACDCGCALELIGWPDRLYDEPVAAVISLRVRGAPEQSERKADYDRFHELPLRRPLRTRTRRRSASA